MVMILFIGLVMNFLEFFFFDIRKGNGMFYSDCVKFLESNLKYLFF